MALKRVVPDAGAVYALPNRKQPDREYDSEPS
jgi:hypothetical protein